MNGTFAIDFSRSAINGGLSTLPVASRWNPEYAQLDPRVQQFISNLRNKHGDYCCADADGYRPNDQDIVWDVKASRYRAKISDQWIEVPDYAKLDDANIVGRAIVWVWSDQSVGVGGVLRVRCFLPGAEL
jgi:hypothetical protein